MDEKIPSFMYINDCSVVGVIVTNALARHSFWLISRMVSSLLDSSRIYFPMMFSDGTQTCFSVFLSYLVLIFIVS